MIWKLVDLDQLFYPKNAIVLVGVSDAPIKGASAFLYAMRQVNCPIPVYCVNKNRDRVLFEEKAYPSILDIPKDVEIDYAIVGVPAKDVPQAIKECKQRKIKFVTVFTSGFSELGTKEGIELEQKIIESAKGGPRLIGPNCLGVFCRENHLTITEILDISENKGVVAFLSQSGGHTGAFYLIGENRGFPFNKVVSIGNQCDLKVQDFVEYWVKDEEIKVITLYLEQIKDVQNFLRILNESAKLKPIIVWKGGQTREGCIAASSHTGALITDSPYKLFESTISKNGGILASSMEELADLTLGALFLSKKKLGKRIGMLVPGGGSCVEMTDEAANEGLEIPELTVETRDKIQDIIQDINTSTRNPVDLGVLGWIPKTYGKTISYIAEDPNVDIVIFYLMTERMPHMAMRLNDNNLQRSFLRSIKRSLKTSEKPFICILPNFILTDIDITRRRSEIIEGLTEMQIPHFPSMSHAASVIKKLIIYQQFLRK